jgi:predicted O-methyltransferase YrrM
LPGASARLSWASNLHADPLGKFVTGPLQAKDAGDPSAGDFSYDWFSANIPNWEKFLSPLRDREISALEIGCFEGRASVFILTHLHQSKLICIDTFIDYGHQLDFEARFDSNVARFGDRVQKIRGRSAAALDCLVEAGAQFDFIYIDGSHARDDVMIDSLLAWKLSKQGTVIIWDDYEWNLRPDRPREAIDDFLSLHGNQLTVLHKGTQVIAVRN